jgi:hypothetical protein
MVSFLRGVAQQLSKLIDHRVNAAVELYDGVIGPQFLLDFFAARYFASMIYQDPQDPEGLFLQHYLASALRQLTRVEVELKCPEANANWQRVFHGNARKIP